MWQGHENRCPYCGASEEKFVSEKGCCEEAHQAKLQQELDDFIINQQIEEYHEIEEYLNR